MNRFPLFPLNEQVVRMFQNRTTFGQLQDYIPNRVVQSGFACDAMDGEVHAELQSLFDTTCRWHDGNCSTCCVMSSNY